MKESAKKISAGRVVGNNKIAKLSLVGVGMRSHAGIASTMFKALAEEGINIQLVSTSEIKISVIIDEKYLELGVRILHDVFGLDKPEHEEREISYNEHLILQQSAGSNKIYNSADNATNGTSAVRNTRTRQSAVRKTRSVQ